MNEYYDSTLYLSRDQFQPYVVIVKGEKKHFSSRGARDSYIELQDEIRKELEFENSKIKE